MRSLPFLLVLALATGCVGGEAAPDERTFSATGGVVTEGWQYGGGPALASDATLSGRTVDGANTGMVHVEFTLDGVLWIIHIDRFAQGEGKDFQDGGIEHGLTEHGDTGVADASIPRIHATVAAWGDAAVRAGGTLLTPEPWAAHLMIAEDTVRVGGKITKADGTTPYDPASPGDATRVEGDPQALFFIKHPQGETFSRGAVGVGSNLTCDGPQCAEAAELLFEEGAARLDLNVTYVAGGPFPLAVGRATFSVVDANGTVLHESSEVQVVPGGPPPVESVSVPLVGVPLPVSLRVSGDGAFTARAEGTVTYEDRPFLVITWDEPTVS